MNPSRGPEVRAGGRVAVDRRYGRGEGLAWVFSASKPVIGILVHQLVDDGALATGKITPATVDYHRAQCSQDGGLERFAAFVAAAPAIGDPSGLDGKEAPAGATAMNAEQRQVMEMFGNTPEDIAKYGV